MPQLPLPPLPLGIGIDGGDLPVSSSADVSAEWAVELMQPTSAPIRDAIIAGETAMLLAYQSASRYAACQSDPGRATDEYEDECGEERGVFRATTEIDTPMRARMLARPGVVDPNDIVAAANAILAPYTTISCRYAERSDGCFLNDGLASWSSHIFQEALLPSMSAAKTPNYPDRLYPPVSGGGVSAPNRRPPGAMLNADNFGRWFLLRAPDITLVDSNVAAVYDGNQNVTMVGGFFIGKGTVGTVNTTFVYNVSATVQDIYNALIGAVNSIIGHGIRWSLFVDPYLTT